MITINKNAKSIREEGYSFVLNQCLKVGTHIFSLGTLEENYKIFEQIVTDKMEVDDWGYLCVVLEDVNTGLKMLERIELLACSLHTHNNNEFLTREEAEKERQLRFQKILAEKNGNQLPIEFVKLVAGNTITDVELELTSRENGKGLMDDVLDKK